MSSILTLPFLIALSKINIFRYSYVLFFFIIAFVNKTISMRSNVHCMTSLANHVLFRQLAESGAIPLIIPFVLVSSEPGFLRRNRFPGKRKLSSAGECLQAHETVLKFFFGTELQDKSVIPISSLPRC